MYFISGHNIEKKTRKKRQKSGKSKLLSLFLLNTVQHILLLLIRSFILILHGFYQSFLLFMTILRTDPPLKCTNIFDAKDEKRENVSITYTHMLDHKTSLEYDTDIKLFMRPQKGLITVTVKYY